MDCHLAPDIQGNEIIGLKINFPRTTIIHNLFEIHYGASIGILFDKSIVVEQQSVKKEGRETRIGTRWGCANPGFLTRAEPRINRAELKLEFTI